MPQVIKRTNRVRSIIDVPPVVSDLRIAKLRRAFGARPFSTHGAARTLGISMEAAFKLLFHEPGLEDQTSRVVMEHGDWRVIAVHPEESYAQQAFEKYWLILRTKHEWFADDFARQANIPFATGNYLLSLMVRFGQMSRCPHRGIYSMPPRKKVRER